MFRFFQKKKKKKKNIFRAKVICDVMPRLKNYFRLKINNNEKIRKLLASQYRFEMYVK